MLNKLETSTVQMINVYMFMFSCLKKYVFTTLLHLYIYIHIDCDELINVGRVKIFILKYKMVINIWNYVIISWSKTKGNCSTNTLI